MLAARLVGHQLTRAGTIALLATTFSEDFRNANVSDRLAGFKEIWGPLGRYELKPCPIIEVATSADISAALADPELAYIVAFDSKSAEAALDALDAQAKKRCVPIVAFDPSEAVFDAIGDGRVQSAIFHDPYRSGFAAIERLGVYRAADKDSLPIPGHGSYLLVSEVVQKENLAEIRRRLDRCGSGSKIGASPTGAHGPPQAYLSALTNAARGT